MTATVTVIQIKVLERRVYDVLRKSPVGRVFSDEFVRTLASVIARSVWKEGFRPAAEPEHVVHVGQQTIFKEGA